ncbi:MAG TPA: hypothetical protein PLY86_21560 [bacterium]|nr:hypothetical protein [bacterium]
MFCPLFPLTAALLIGLTQSSAESVLPMGSAPKPLDFAHFPSRMHTFIWRNWPLVEVGRLAEVLGTSPENVRAVAESMGLLPQQPVAEKDRNRIHISLIRRNWHLLPYSQLMTLLDMSAEELAYTLREDDFLFIKLGLLKPDCAPLQYTPPTPEQLRRCKEIQKIAEEIFGSNAGFPQEKPLQFIEELSRKDPAIRWTGKPETSRFSPRYIYSYFAVYGDPLMNPDLDPFPEGLLQRLSALGVDGVWMHTVLRQLSPSDIFPEFGENHETRLKNLRRLVERAKEYGIGIYLYMNEPRAMPPAFFEKREHLRGVEELGYFTMCTSTPEVQRWLTDSLAYVFANVPGLAGVFTITASENLTNCASHYKWKNCPNCKDRTASEIIAEVNTLIETGVHRGNPDAKVIAWDWGWQDEWACDAIRQLPKSVLQMSVSEWSQPIRRGGVESTVGEYSISVVGPGPRATKHWAASKECGLNTMAKVQFNNTWELSAVPYLPVMDLIARHCENLLTANVDGLMMSWTLGGYPSANLELVQKFDRDPAPTKEEALDALATDYFGSGAADARKAWTAFSNAFQEYPYNGGVVYNCPVQYGPSNLLYATPTGYAATMVGLPYDDVDGWRGPYPPEIFAEQFEKVASGWKTGLADLERAVEQAPLHPKRKVAEEQLKFARAAQLHFATVANQTRFTLARNALLNTENPLPETERQKTVESIRRIVQDEIRIAWELYGLACADSRIGFEATNHYYYIPSDLVEKVINCRYILQEMTAPEGNPPR